jgi:hypothetical protein
VTAPDVPPLAGATKVPEPVNSIFRPEGADPLIAEANATPPGLTVGGVVVGSKWIMSQRTAWAWPYTGRAPAVIDSSTADTSAAIRIDLFFSFYKSLLAHPYFFLTV